MIVALSDDSLNRDFPIGIIKWGNADSGLASISIPVAVAVTLVQLELGMNVSICCRSKRMVPLPLLFEYKGQCETA